MKNCAKVVILAVLVYLCALLTGCMNGVEISGRAFVESIWVDKNKTDFCINAGIFEDEALYGEGETISQALANIEAAGEKRLFLGHTQMLFVGNGITSLKEDLSFFLTSNKLSPTLRIVLLERGSDYSDFSAAKMTLAELSNAANGSRTVETDCAGFFGESEVLLPVLKCGSDGSAVFSGCELLSKGLRTHELSEDEVLGSRLLLGKAKSFTLPVTVGRAVATVVADKVKITSAGGIFIKGRVTETVGTASLPAIEAALKTRLELLTGVEAECKLTLQRKF